VPEKSSAFGWRDDIAARGANMLHRKLDCSPLAWNGAPGILFGPFMAEKCAQLLFVIGKMRRQLNKLWTGRVGGRPTPEQQHKGVEGDYLFIKLHVVAHQLAQMFLN
jgi:hypothetical protein